MHLGTQNRWTPPLPHILISCSPISKLRLKGGGQERQSFCRPPGPILIKFRLKRAWNYAHLAHQIQSFLGGGAEMLRYDTFKSVEVQGWTPLKILIFLHWTCRPTFTTLLRKRRAISHLMAVPKNRGKCKSATTSLHRGDSLSASGPLVFLSKGVLPPCTTQNYIGAYRPT